MKSGSTLSDVATRVDAIRRSIRDFLAKPAHLGMTINEGVPRFALDDGSGVIEFGLQEHVHDQLAALADIPLAYYRRMRTEAPELLAQNTNTWLRRGDARRMVRTIRADDQPVVRAVLSDRYRPLDSYQLLEAVLPLLHARGIRIESCELTERKLYLKAVSERTTAEVKVGEAVQAGLMITNSEVGYGALAIQPLVYTLRCTNGMVLEDSSMRRNHVGRRNGDSSSDDLQHLLTDETRAADDKAFFLRVRDVATAALDEAVFRRHVDRLRAAAGSPITSNALDKVVEVTAKRFGLSQEEGDGVLAHLIRGGDLSQWGLCSAITRYSQDVASYDRATDLERIGGKLVELPKAEWSTIASMN